MRLTRVELIDLYVRITDALPDNAGRFREPANRAHQPAQHPDRAGAARPDTMTTRNTLPVQTGRVSACTLCKGDRFNHFVRP
jgi:hypothetical protein